MLGDNRQFVSDVSLSPRYGPRLNLTSDADALDDLVEEVFLCAFEGYSSRPKEARLGNWIEGLIDPAVKELQRNGHDELENIKMARTARAARQGPDAV